MVICNDILVHECTKQLAGYAQKPGLALTREGESFPPPKLENEFYQVSIVV